MATAIDPTRQCPACGSDDREATDRERVPGGTDWRYYSCIDCGNEWRV
ncbi:hypothetical protein [Halapricum sp. CBA1109]|jgi:DNA-directed RNA polymerase subunit M/transcription elongation factor TFIIS|nr:hypothetical protein [Halapricum sp. CBA1109]